MITSLSSGDVWDYKKNIWKQKVRKGVLNKETKKIMVGQMDKVSYRAET